MAVFIQNREEFEQRLVIMKTQEGWSILRMKKVSALKQGRYSNGSSAWRRYA